MSNAKDVIKAQLAMGANLLQQFSSDLSDDDYLFQPTDGGCHLIWILGHLACTQDWAVSEITGRPLRLLPDTQELFKGGSTVSGDRSKYPPRAEAEDLFRETQAHTLSVLDTYDMARWDDPTPDDVPSEFFPTMGSLWSMLPSHTYWHFGQLTVNRRMMGKSPRLM